MQIITYLNKVCNTRACTLFDKLNNDESGKLEGNERTRFLDRVRIFRECANFHSGRARGSRHNRAALPIQRGRRAWGSGPEVGYSGVSIDTFENRFSHRELSSFPLGRARAPPFGDRDRARREAIISARAESERGSVVVMVVDACR